MIGFNLFTKPKFNVLFKKNSDLDHSCGLLCYHKATSTAVQTIQALTREVEIKINRNTKQKMCCVFTFICQLSLLYETGFPLSSIDFCVCCVLLGLIYETMHFFAFNE